MREGFAFVHKQMLQENKNHISPDAVVSLEVPGSLFPHMRFFIHGAAFRDVLQYALRTTRLSPFYVPVDNIYAHPYK